MNQTASRSLVAVMALATRLALADPAEVSALDSQLDAVNQRIGSSISGRRAGAILMGSSLVVLAASIVTANVVMSRCTPDRFLCGIEWVPALLTGFVSAAVLLLVGVPVFLAAGDPEKLEAQRLTLVRQRDEASRRPADAPLNLPPL